MKCQWLGYSAPAAALLAALCLVPASPAAQAPARPGWAFPAIQPGFQPPKDDGSLKHAPGSTKAYTMTQINDPYGPPDWYPEDHPPFPLAPDCGPI